MIVQECKEEGTTDFSLHIPTELKVEFGHVDACAVSVLPAESGSSVQAMHLATAASQLLPGLAIICIAL